MATTVPETALDIIETLVAITVNRSTIYLDFYWMYLSFGTTLPTVLVVTGRTDSDVCQHVLCRHLEAHNALNILCTAGTR